MPTNNIVDLDFSIDYIELQRARLKQLLQEKALLHGDFILASGQKSNYYLDTRLITLSAEGNALIAYNILALMRDLPAIQAIAGPVLGACPIITGVSQLSYWLKQPLKSLYIRKEPKGHGTTKLIEGDLQAGERVLMPEDVITSGNSVMKAIEAIREAGGAVDDLICLVLRDQTGAQNLKEKLQINTHYLFNIEELL